MKRRATPQDILTAALLRNDFYSFVQAAFPIVASQKELLRNWHIEAMTYALTRVLFGEIVNRRGLRPTIGVQCGPSVPAHKPFIDILKMPMRVGPSWAPMWVNFRGRFTSYGVRGLSAGSAGAEVARWG